MTGSRKLQVVVVALVFVAVAWAFGHAGEPAHQSTNIALPEASLQTVVDGVYIYATNQDMQELLTGLDIHFKSQGLDNDKDSPIFQYTSGQKGSQKIETCTEFKYFRNDMPVARFTLIPKDPGCLSTNPQVQAQIKKLQTRFNYVYSARLED